LIQVHSRLFAAKDFSRDPKRIRVRLGRQLDRI